MTLILMYFSRHQRFCSAIFARISLRVMNSFRKRRKNSDNWIEYFFWKVFSTQNNKWKELPIYSMRYIAGRQRVIWSIVHMQKKDIRWNCCELEESVIGQSNDDFINLSEVLRKRGGGRLNAIFDSQAENFLSQSVQSTKSTETEFCWLSTQ